MAAGDCVFDMCDKRDEIYDVLCGTLTPDLPNSLRKRKTAHITSC